MQKKIQNHLIAVGAIFMATTILSSCTSNWPQFRGPETNMVATSKHLPEEWGEDHNVRWTTEIDGDSWTSPVVWGKRIFVASAVAVKVSPPPPRRDRQSPPAEQQEDKSYLEDVYRWQITCVDLDSGEELWKQVAYEGSPRTKKHRATNYASETPVTDGKRVYVYFGMTGLFCYDLDGELVWKKDLGAYETLNGWGTGSSPVVYKEMLYIQVDNEEKSFLVALDKVTGEEVWRVDRDETTNYSTPMIWKNSVRTELVVGGKKARSYDPATGKLLWEVRVDGYYNIPSPVADKDFLYLGNKAHRDTPGTLLCVKAGANGDITPPEGETVSNGVVWSNWDAPTSNPSPLLHNGLLYLLSNRGGELSCLEAATGEVVFMKKMENVAACWASPWVYEGKIYFIDDKGVTTVIRAGREFELLHRNKLEDKFWASVAVTRDAYILKGVERMYCIGD